MNNLYVILNWDFIYEKRGHRKVTELAQGLTSKLGSSDWQPRSVLKPKL